MKALVERVAERQRVAIALDEVDISKDPALELRYGLEIPVLFVNGTKTAKYRVTEAEFARMLGARRD